MYDIIVVNGAQRVHPGVTGICQSERRRRGVERGSRPKARRAPPAVRGGAQETTRAKLGLSYFVNALPILAADGLDLESHLFSQRPRNEAAHGMTLPLGRGHDLVQGGSAGPLQQVEDPRLLAALAGFTGCRLRLPRRFGGLG